MKTYKEPEWITDALPKYGSLIRVQTGRDDFAEWFDCFLIGEGGRKFCYPFHQGRYEAQYDPPAIVEWAYMEDGAPWMNVKRDGVPLPMRRIITRGWAHSFGSEFHKVERSGVSVIGVRKPLDIDVIPMDQVDRWIYHTKSEICFSTEEN